MSEKIRAPFTQEQAAALNRFQNTGRVHPFTCPREHDIKANLIAVSGTTPNGQEGWVCVEPRCDYAQDWAFAFMLVDPEIGSDWSEPDTTDLENNLIVAGALLALLQQHGVRTLGAGPLTSVKVVTGNDGGVTNQIDIGLAFMASPYRITVERVIDADISGPKHTGLFASMSDD